MKSYWLVLFLLAAVVLPQMSESVFSPYVLLIANEYSVSVGYAEQVFSYYLIGYALGVLFWGILIDMYPALNIFRSGLIFYIGACLLCWKAPSIGFLLFARMLQGFGGSVCTIVVIVVNRLLFQGKERARMQANISMALSAGPALGPIMSSMVEYASSWQMIYIPLIIYACALVILSYQPEPVHEPSPVSMDIIIESLVDIRIWCYAAMIGLSCGIGFSFFSEAPFLFIEGLGMSKDLFTYCFIGVAASWFIGGRLSRYLLAYFPIKRVITIGVVGAVCTTLCFAYLMMFFAAEGYMLYIALLLAYLVMVAVGLIIGNTYTLALEPYTTNIGTKASILSFLNYVFIATSAHGMSVAHNGQVDAMPTFWFKLLFIVLFLHAILHLGKRGLIEHIVEEIEQITEESKT
ncbi:MFS transporter [Candidatus Comchoanobacter bicostacola]|uniref:MFS transporter n=1 Tax=Candidatus Comchoanobacter bicostacola TaxID=2919598 RepID=A0ABY5DK92_9GAMM|nr:MFS transporter [Candidatus Comchoanobacter bicostacola]UTC24903.1 MFS transporter [Candidatus Comchoanobacter bicostacola]